MPNTLYVIDVFSLMFQVFHAIPPMTGRLGQPTNAVFGFTRDIMTILGKQKPSHLLCAIDSEGEGQRSGWYTEYKANRTEMPEELVPQIPMILSMLEGFNVPVIKFPGWEADDVMATVTKRACSEGFEVRLVTSDKDCRQLLSDCVQMFNCRKNEFFGPANLMETWGVTPEQVIDFQSLVGDSVDNVPGVPGIGPVAATQLIKEYGDLESVLANAPKITAKKRRENLIEFADQARISKKLVTLYQDLPLEFNFETAKVGSINGPRLLELFNDFGFKKFRDEILTLGLETGLQASDIAASEPAPAAVAKPASKKPPIKVGRGLFDDQENDDEAAEGAESIRQDVLFANSQLAGRTWQVIDTPEKFAGFIEILSKQEHICFDLETTGLDANQADIVGWAFCFEPGSAYYLPVMGPKDSQLLDSSATLETLKPILTNPGVKLSNQNIKYDLLVLKRLGINIEEVYLDSMIAHFLLDAGARTHGLDTLAYDYLGHKMISIKELIGTGKSQKLMSDIPVAQVAEYASEDADAAFRLSLQLEQQLKDEQLWDLYWDLERPLIITLKDMEAVGITVNVDELKKQSDELAHQLDLVRDEINQLAGHPFNFDSPKQLQDVLFNELKLPKKKKTKTGASTDQSVLEELAPLHPLPAKIITHRQLSKLKNTYLDALPSLVNPYTGRIHTSFSQVSAATGRLASSDPNLQNIPIRTEEGRKIRKAFVAGQPGWSLVAADYSQIELRILAEFSGDEAMQNAFRSGHDIHRMVASEIFSTPQEEVTSEMRRIAKAVNFGIIYGQSPYGLAAALGIPQEQAAAFIESYFDRYPGVEKFIQDTLIECQQTGYAKTILGRRRPIEGIRTPFGRNRNLPERTAVNTVIQGSAADLIKRAMVNIHARLKKEKHPALMLLQIHDELVFETPDIELESLCDLVNEEMTTALKLKVPLEIDMASGPNWLETKG